MPCIPLCCRPNHGTYLDLEDHAKGNITIEGTVPCRSGLIAEDGAQEENDAKAYNWSMVHCMPSHIINHTLIKHRYTTLLDRVLIIKPEILVELNKHHSIHGMLVQTRVNTDGKSRACTKRHTKRTITFFSMPIWLSIKGWNSSPRCTLKGNGPFWEDLQATVFWDTRICSSRIIQSILCRLSGITGDISRTSGLRTICSGLLHSYNVYMYSTLTTRFMQLDSCNAIRTRTLIQYTLYNSRIDQNIMKHISIYMALPRTRHHYWDTVWSTMCNTRADALAQYCHRQRANTPSRRAFP